MKEKIKVLSLFSSGGVAEAYFEDLGIEISLANEIDEERAKFYSHLYPKAQMITGDITNHILRKRLIDIAKINKINCILATPPCQGMSIAGSLDPLDKRNKLITYAIDVIKKLKPKYIMLENVPMQLVTKIRYKNKIVNIPEYIKSELQNSYNFNAENIIKTMDYGIPQMRKRNIFLLVRKDLGFMWNFPKLNKRIVSLKEALKNIPSLDPSLREGYEETLKMFPDFEKKKEKGFSYHSNGLRW
jgi:DNA (cytosine-5)-methyltransferase 1